MRKDILFTATGAFFLAACARPQEANQRNVGQNPNVPSQAGQLVSAGSETERLVYEKKLKLIKQGESLAANTAMIVVNSNNPGLETVYIVTDNRFNPSSTIKPVKADLLDENNEFLKRKPYLDKATRIKAFPLSDVDLPGVKYATGDAGLEVLKIEFNSGPVAAYPVSIGIKDKGYRLSVKSDIVSGRGQFFSGTVYSFGNK